LKENNHDSSLLTPHSSQHPAYVLIARLFQTLALSASLIPFFLQGETEIPGLSIELPSGALEIGYPEMRWKSPENRWILEHTTDLNSWRHVEAAGYKDEGNEEFSWQNTSHTKTAFYRLRSIGEPHIYVVGDSISTRAVWPTNLAHLSGRRVFTQAVGGTRSPSMVSRTQGVELASISTPQIVGGRLVTDLQLHRYSEWRTTQPSYRTVWAEVAKTVAEPESIEIFVDGIFAGYATNHIKSFQTNYDTNPKQITCEGHGLTEGDRVVFLGGDLDYPDNLSVTDGNTQWRYTSPNLPPSVIERRIYYVAEVQPDSFEIKEFTNETNTLDLGGDATSDARIECGWKARVSVASENSEITWKPRTKYDDWIWLLEVSANDIPGNPAATYTLPNIDRLIAQMREIKPRYLIITPPIGSQPDRGPGTFNWTNYHHSYLTLVHEKYGDRVLDTQALMNPLRTENEFSFLDDPATPQLLWIAGTPTNQETWQASPERFEGASQQWVGPGFTPLQFRARFNDPIHLGTLSSQLIGERVSEILIEKGW